VPAARPPRWQRLGLELLINREELIWNCFVCGEGGVIPELVARVNDCSYKEAVQWLAEFSDADAMDDTELFVRQLEGYAQKKEYPRHERGGTLPWFPEDSCVRYEADLDGLQELLDQKWGIQLETAHAWKLGFDLSHERHGYTGPALIIPHWFRGQLVGWQERWLVEDRPKSLPKYTNTPGFPRSNTIFGWDRIQPARHRIVLVESVMTVIRLWQENIPAIASFGGTLNADQLRLLRTCERGIIYSPDEGEVGERAARKVVSALSRHVPVWVTDPPETAKGDLADLASPAIWQAIGSAVPSFLL